MVRSSSHGQAVVLGAPEPLLLDALSFCRERLSALKQDFTAGTAALDSGYYQARFEALPLVVLVIGLLFAVKWLDTRVQAVAASSTHGSDKATVAKSVHSALRSRFSL